MSERPPTPTGWSDTDWIKKLQHEEENPLGCLHINQGSFDAAADAYEEEYKMSKRTAMDIALDLDAAACSSFVKLEAAEALRQQQAEVERLKADAERVNSCAKNLAIAMHGQHFSHVTQWEPLPDTLGLISQIDNMSCWHDAEIERLKRERHHLYDLLARIHRAGNQSAAEHGVEKSCDDAEAQVVAWLDTINNVDALVEQARIAEREACAVVCENGNFLHDAAPTAIFGKECARAIRARSAT